jgi:hypothetical protein
MATELYEVFEELGHVVEMLARLEREIRELEPGPLRCGILRQSLRVALRDAEWHYRSAEVLLTHDVADTFPDGSPAPASLTPKQVDYLAALAVPHLTREMMGLPPSRSCASETLSGDKCGSSSLIFTTRAVCASHATPAEKERNRKAKDAWRVVHPDHHLG